MKWAENWLTWAAVCAVLGWALIGAPLPGGTSAVALAFDRGPSLLVIDGDQVARRTSLTGVEVFVDRQACGSFAFADAPRTTGGDFVFRLDAPGQPAKCDDDGAFVHLFSLPGGGLLQSHPRLNGGGETHMKQLGPEPTDTGWAEYFAGGARPMGSTEPWPYLGGLLLAVSAALVLAWLLPRRRPSL